jgi:hypothetical protein
MWDGETYERLAFGPPALSDPEAFLQAALRYPLRNFGEVSYSSSNYAAVDIVLERETGEPLGELLREHVFEPYGLARTTFQTGLELPPDVAHGYALKGGTFPAVESPRDVSLYWTDRSVAADVFDLAAFFRRLFRAHPEMVDGGLGVRDYDHPRGTAYGHGGAMAGYTPSSCARTATASMSSSPPPIHTAFPSCARSGRPSRSSSSVRADNQRSAAVAKSGDIREHWPRVRLDTAVLGFSFVASRKAQRAGRIGVWWCCSDGGGIGRQRSVELRLRL